MSANTFLRPAEFYQRTINPISQYATQSAFYLHRMTGYSMEYCRDYTIKGIKERKFDDIRDPQIDFFHRGENGDRKEDSYKLSHYINSVVSEDLILAPTFTAYVKPGVIKSLLAGFTDKNKKLRSVAKKAAAAAKAEGKMDLFIIKNNEQDNKKRYNNSLSGCFVAGGSVVRNPTAHSTLTSITRTVGSLGNASNEKIISGNRHYRNADITLDNLIAICTLFDRDELLKAITEFGLKFPTVEETIRCIKYSSDLYWNDHTAFRRIITFLEKLEPLELAAIVYTGDFYHLRQLNDGFVHRFVTQLARKVKGVVVPNAMDVVRNTDEMVMNYAHQVCMTEVKGIGKKYEKLSEFDLNTLAATALNIERVVEEHRSLINAIFLSKIIPASTAYIPNLIRRTVVLSDTDSTMFSMDEWVNWYFNELRFDDEGFALSGAIMFVATQSIAHTLAIFSANMNVERSDLFTLAMKPEYVFPVFAQSAVAKHYYTITYVKEGSVYEKPEMEIKGVHLKNSAAPKEIVKAAAAKMEEILLSVMAGKKISIIDNLKNVMALEKTIIDSLSSGQVQYLKTSKIKEAAAYALDEMKSPYQHHQLWLDVFVPKYHIYEHPTYSVFKIPTKLTNKSKVAKWLASMEDRQLAERMGSWLKRYNKSTLGTMYVSVQYAKSYGIPKEIVDILDMKKIVLDLTNAHRMILGTLGFFGKTGWLITDLITTEEL